MEFQNVKPISQIREEERLLAEKDAKIVQLESENTLLRQQLAQFNGDMSSFIDFYFSQFPEQA